MAVTIHRAIHAVPPLYAAKPGPYVGVYTQYLTALFDRAARVDPG